MGTQFIRTYCPLCISRCGAVATVEDGVLRKLEADPQHPTGGTFCIKGRAAAEMVYSEHRLLTPLRRSGPRGPGSRWVPIGWEEALDEIARKMETIRRERGPQALVVGVTTTSGTSIADAFGWIHRLAHAYGSPNVLFATETCNWHKDFSPQLTFGSGLGMPDLKHSGCLLLWGANPSTSWPALALEIRKAQRRGMKLVVVDPRGEGLAREAELWLRLRPGSDKALALGLAGELLRLGAVDRDFLSCWSNGPWLVRDDTDELLLKDGKPLVWNVATGAPEEAPRPGAPGSWALEGCFSAGTSDAPIMCRPAFECYARRCRAMTLEHTEALTGVPVGDLRRAATLMAECRPLSLHAWTGLCQHADATQTTRAVSLLYALSGDWDAPGGNVSFTRLPLNDVSGVELLPPRMLEDTLGRGERPLGPGRRGWISASDLADALSRPQPPVRGVLAFGGNWLATKPLPDDFSTRLDKLDFFAVAEMFLTPTARLADLVLPVASPWEREGLCPGFGVSQHAESRLQLRPALVPPRGQSRPDRWIVFELAKRLGLEEEFFQGDGEGALNHVLARTGLTAQALRDTPGGVDLALTTSYHKYRTAGFATPSGRVEIFSSELQRHGYSAVPELEAAAPDGAAWPFVLVSVKEVASCHSQYRQFPSLRRHAPLPTVTVHPSTGSSLDLREGDRLSVVTARGQVAAQVRFDKKLAPDVVTCPYGWHEDAQQDLAERWPGTSVNFASLADPADCDPASGSNNLKAIPCRLVKST